MDNSKISIENFKQFIHQNREYLEKINSLDKMLSKNTKIENKLRSLKFGEKENIKKYDFQDENITKLFRDIQSTSYRLGTTKESGILANADTISPASQTANLSLYSSLILALLFGDMNNEESIKENKENKDEESAFNNLQDDHEQNIKRLYSHLKDYIPEGLPKWYNKKKFRLDLKNTPDNYFILNFLADILKINIFVIDVNLSKFYYCGSSSCNIKRKHILLVQYEKNYFEPILLKGNENFDLNDKVFEFIKKYSNILKHVTLDNNIIKEAPFIFHSVADDSIDLSIINNQHSQMRVSKEIQIETEKEESENDDNIDDNQFTNIETEKFNDNSTNSEECNEECNEEVNSDDTDTIKYCKYVDSESEDSENENNEIKLLQQRLDMLQKKQDAKKSDALNKQPEIKIKATKKKAPPTEKIVEKIIEVEKESSENTEKHDYKKLTLSELKELAKKNKIKLSKDGKAKNKTELIDDLDKYYT